jgi:hypothetical protein
MRKPQVRPGGAEELFAKPKISRGRKGKAKSRPMARIHRTVYLGTITYLCEHRNRWLSLVSPFAILRGLRGEPNSIGAGVFTEIQGRLIHPARVRRQLSRAVLRPRRAEDGPTLARVRTVDCKYRGACHLPSSQIALNGNKSATDKEGQSHISKPIKMDICASFPTSSIRVIRAHPWSKS